MPLLLLAFGFGDASKIALVAIAVFFPVAVNTYAGAANIEKLYWDVAKNYGASQYRDVHPHRVLRRAAD